MNMRILGVAPGEKKTGLALPDPPGLIARPLTTFAHTSRDDDAARIAALAAEHQAEMILIGHALDASGEPGPQARRAERLAEAVRQHTALPVNLHDESYSTQAAHAVMLTPGKKRHARRAQVHTVAA